MNVKHRLGRGLYPAAALAATAAACAPVPQLRTAPEVMSINWRGPALAASETPLSSNLGQAFGSSELEALIARAQSANADLGIAASRIDQARAQLRLARAETLPVVSASAGLAGSRMRAGSRRSDVEDNYAGLDVAFALDLFGKARAGRRAADARYAAARFDREALALVVEGEVARAFVQQAALTRRLALLDRNIEQARELLRIIEVRQRLGEATRVDTGLQTIQLRQLEVEHQRLLQARSRTSNALAVLVGKEAPLFAAPQGDLSTLAVPPIATVQPALLLVRRPDVRAAESRIAASEGDVAQARAAFLPSLGLSAGGLAEAASLGNPIGTIVSAGVGLLAPIFDGGRMRGNLDMVTAQQAESVELYRKTLLTAFAEAEDALEAVRRSSLQEALLDTIVAEAITTARLARRQYVEGDADLQWVLDAEQRLVQAEDSRAIARQERLQAAVDLYRAMGGSPAALFAARGG